ncbi:MAG: hypothetical protein K9M11_04205 [Candidatus Pacebacteria bacterium]|nr:hypothetical protein [Candidatus Paceibacterota bacterium]
MFQIEPSLITYRVLANAYSYMVGRLQMQDKALLFNQTEIEYTVIHGYHPMVAVRVDTQFCFCLCILYQSIGQLTQEDKASFEDVARFFDRQSSRGINKGVKIDSEYGVSAPTDTRITETSPKSILYEYWEKKFRLEVGLFLQFAEMHLLGPLKQLV